MAHTRTKKSAKSTSDTPSNDQSRDDAIMRLVVWSGWVSLAYIVQAAIVLFVAKAQLVPVQVSYVTKDALSSAMSDHTVYGAATRQFFEVNVAYIVCVALLVMAAIHGWATYVHRKQYADALRAGRNHFRWIAFGVLTALSAVGLTLLLGMYSLPMLLAVLVLAAVSALLGHYSERQSSQAVWSVPRVAAAIAGLGIWLIVGLIAGVAALYGDGTVPGLLFAAYGLVALSACAMWGIPLLQSKRPDMLSDQLVAERTYLLLSLITMTGFAWLVYAASLR